MHLEKQISYKTTNTYSTLNTFNPKTKNIWMTCHGIGYLSEYFISHFKNLDPVENYVIAPQAPSKYYQDKSYKYIGASWFTRKDLQQETENVINYLDAVYLQEIHPRLNEQINIILMGYSQGVSAITRWIARSQINCSKLLLHSGGLPPELTAAHFRHLRGCKVVLIYGDQDEHLKGSSLEDAEKKYQQVWGDALNIHKFAGKHEVNEHLLEEYAL